MRYSLKKILIPLILVIICLAGFRYYYFSYLQELPTTSERKTTDLCTEFPKVKGEISCQEAINKVLEQYPGEVKYVKKTKTSLPMGILPNIEMVEKEVWLIGVNLNPPLEMDEREFKGMEIFVTRDSGDLEINYVTSEEI